MLKMNELGYMTEEFRDAWYAGYYATWIGRFGNQPESEINMWLRLTDLLFLLGVEPHVE